MVDLVGPAQSPSALAGQKPPAGFGLLMGVQLRLSPELGSPSPGSLPTVVGAPDDALALVFGQCGQEGNEAAADRRPGWSVMP